jgi:UDP-glucose 4-epimerase
MKHCLVTGGAGFIGSHLAEALLARGDRVSVIDDESTGSVDNLAAILKHPRFQYTKGTVADRDLIRRAVADVDEVYHLAAAVGVALIARSPIHTIETNVYPTEILLEELDRRKDAGRVIRLFLASTSEVYGKNPKPRWNEEEDLVFGPTTRPRWSYGVSKAIDEFLALAYHSERGLPVVIGRFFNVVGPRQTGAYGMVLPRFVEAALDSRPLTVHDDGGQIRCFGHVSDVIRAVIGLMETPAAVGRVFNIGSDQPVSILELAQRVVAQIDPNAKIEFQSYAEAYSSDFEDCRRRIPDLTRLRSTIGFEPKYDLDDVIREVIAWKRQQRDARPAPGGAISG